MTTKVRPCESLAGDVVYPSIVLHSIICPAYCVNPEATTQAKPMSYGLFRVHNRWLAECHISSQLRSPRSHHLDPTQGVALVSCPPPLSCTVSYFEPIAFPQQPPPRPNPGCIFGILSPTVVFDNVIFRAKCCPS